MSFRYEAFYLIEPRSALADRLRERVEPDFVELLMEPILYRKQESTGSEWLHSERLVQVKLLFLASLRQYDSVSDDTGFEAVFGSARISETLFDRWWVVRRFEVEQELELLEDGLREHLESVASTGNPQVDAWLSAMRGSS